jgi:hypothetical protein
VTFVAVCTNDLHTSISWNNRRKSFREDASNSATVSPKVSSEITHGVRCHFFFSKEPAGNLFISQCFVDFGEFKDWKSDFKVCYDTFYIICTRVSVMKSRGNFHE